MVRSILRNEKYKGSALLQKTFTIDFLNKKIKTNEGEVPQYFIENSHEAIIPPDEWDAVQIEYARRLELGKSYSTHGIFASRIRCADCGSFLGAKVWDSNKKWRRTVWQCNHKYFGDIVCTTPHLTEEDIRARFVKACNELIGSKRTVLKDCKEALRTLTDTDSIERDIAGIMTEMEVTNGLIRKCIDANARGTIDTAEFDSQYAELEKRFTDLEERQKADQKELQERKRKTYGINNFMAELSERKSLLQQFDDQLWLAILDEAVLKPNGKLVFHFKNGAEIEE